MTSEKSDATCNDSIGQCECEAGYSGSGEECTQPSQQQKLVIPLSQIPNIVEDGTRKLVCSDPYWNQIATLEKASVILTVSSWNWGPCIQLLYENGIDVYWKISLYNGNAFGDVESALLDYIDQINTNYNGMVNPYFTNPGDSYKIPLIYNSIAHAQSLGLKVGFEAQNSDWDVDFIKNNDIDLVVLFRDSYEKFTSNCNTLGMGPYCSLDMAGKEWEIISRVTDLVLDVQRGNIQSDNIASIVYNANIEDFDVIRRLVNNFGGNAIWMTENSHYNGAQPSYWDELINRITLPVEQRNSCGCEDVDECSTNAHNCGPNAQCLNMPGGFTCACKSGYSGNGILCQPIDSCLENSHDCSEFASCSSTGPGQWDCACNAGFTGNGVTCDDINECLTSNHNCASTANCANNSGSFSCSCLSGYTGDGVTCQDVDECTTSVCNAPATCTNTAGSFTCSCPSGYQTSGSGCVDVDECDENLDDCSDNGTCQNSYGGYSCSCNQGFQGDGFACSVDMCSMCDSLATCENNSCQCPATHMGSGISCQGEVSESAAVPRRSVIPLEKIPTIEGQTCTDSYWIKIAQMGEGTGVILKSQQTSWLPCMQLLRDSQIDVFATINGRKSQLSDMKTYFYNEIDAIVADFGSAVNGIYISNPGNKGFIQPFFDDVYSYALVKELKVGVAGYKNKYDAGVAGKVDLIITFKDDLEFFNTNCGSQGVGIFCQKSKLSSGQIANIQTKLDSGELSRNTFSAIVTYVLENRMELTMIEAKTAFGGGVFVTNFYKGDTQEPTYFDNFKIVVQNQIKKVWPSSRRRRAAEDCGCEPRNECADGSHSCPVNSNCDDLDFGYSCTCSNGWQDDTSASEFSCIDIDECTSSTHNCHAQATCQNTQGNFTCACKSGFTGDGFVCNDVNECHTRNTDCDENATCVNNQGGHGCFCNEGFTGSGTTCADIDECLEAPCTQNAICTNTIGSFVCTCMSGFEDMTVLNLNLCINVNECDTNQHNCNINADCVDTAGSHECTCRDGYQGNGFECSDVDECSLILDDCSDLSTCANTIGSFTCNCNEGYFLSSGSCIDLNECGTGMDTCAQNADCSNTVGSYTCRCQEGFVGDGFVCDVDICSICDTAATCDGSQCSCPETSTGTGISCDETSSMTLTASKLTIPISKIPVMHAKTTQCTDEYWLKIAEVGAGVNVILDQHQTSWLPCIQHLREHNVNVFATVNGRKGQLSDMEAYFSDSVNALIDDYSGFINGVYIRNPGFKGFKYDWYPAVFQNVRDKGLMIGIEAYSNKYTVDTVKSVDLLVVFKDDIAKFRQNCGSHGIGTLCQNNKLSDNQIDEIYSALETGEIKREQFAAIVGYVLEHEMELTMIQAKASLAGQVFVTNFYEGDTQEPSYFDDFITVLNTQMKKESGRGLGKSQNCGCTDRNECLLGTHICPENSSCTDSNPGYTCACNQGYEHDMAESTLTCVDLDECLNQTHDCDSNGSCSNNAGSFECQCNSGYAGDGKTCSDINECTARLDACDENATCSNLDGSHVCVCNQGYTGDGLSCVDSNECILGSHNCHQEASCSNTDGSFQCSCDTGFTGDGITCTDINECLSPVCHSKATCTNSQGSYVCSCLVGFDGDGQLCTDIDECDLSIDNCHQESTCTNFEGSFDCTCNAGYIESGADCIDVNECVLGTHNCAQNAMCTNTEGSFACDCDVGYSGDGLVCTDQDECNDASACPENSTCVNTDGSFDCSCSIGYIASGSVCQDVDECSLKTFTCQENASCQNTLGSYTCQCNSGFLVENGSCVDVDECADSSLSCQENAVCINNSGSYSCECESGFSEVGLACVDEDECVLGTDTCSENAQCSNTIGSFSCNCDESFVGNGFVCEKDPCTLCDTMATCEDEVCVCPTSHRGNGISCEHLEVAGIDIAKTTVIPINRIPVISVRTAVCRDPYWLKIAEFGPGTSVILQYSESTWLPCIDELRFHGVDVFVTLNGRKGQLSDMKSYFQTQLNEISQKYGGSVNGVYIRNPGNFGFLASFYDEVFDLISDSGYKTGIDGYGTTFDSNVASKVDLVVLFNDNIDKFRQNCGIYGIGPLCSGSALTDEQISEIENEIIFGNLDRDLFVSIIYEVENHLYQTVHAEALASFAGLAFVSNYQVGNTREPEYFDEFALLIEDDAASRTNIGARALSESCGCTSINECAEGSHICPQNSDCYDTTSGYECKCSAGFMHDPAATTTNEFICIDIDECHQATSDCDTNASCINTEGSFSCACLAGFVGDGKFCTDINECSDSSACHENAICTNLLGTHTCVCQDGYTGNGVSCTDSDECEDKTHNCSNQAECSNTDGSFTCQCLQGFAGNGTDCEDVNECEMGTDNCHSMADCTNTPGSYSCSCFDGFSGDEVTCSQDICSICSDKATCDNTECACPVGYSGSGVACQASARPVIPIERIPTISVRTGMCSDPFWYSIISVPGATIITRLQETTWLPCISLARQNSIEVYVTINARYMRLGVTFMQDQIQGVLEDYNGFVVGIHFENPGPGGFVTTDWDEVFQFTKTAGLKISIEGYQSLYDMKTVNTADQIVSFRDNIMKFPSAEPQLSSSFKAELETAITNNFVDGNKFVEMIFDVPATSMTSVLDYAQTQSVYMTDFKIENEFATSMPSYWNDFVQLLAEQSNLGRSGSNCGCTEVDECQEPTSCPENSSCTNTDGSFFCSCENGFIKMTNECVDVDECNQNICHEKATCTNIVGSFECQCSDGFQGDGTESGTGCSDINECSQPMKTGLCQQNASCANTEGSFDCVCNSGFTDNEGLCVDVDECLTTTCDHNMACENTEGSFSCECLSGFIRQGLDCVDVDECSGENGCHDYSTCENTDGSYECTCISGYEGDGTTCVQDVCAICDSSASCLESNGTKDCQCASGFSGSGYSCDVSSIVIPITQMPLITVKSSVCRDNYWIQIANKAKTVSIKVIINDVFDETWLPCLTLISDAGAEIFATVDLREEKLSDTKSYLQSEIENYKSNFPSVSGIHLTNVGSQGYTEQSNFGDYVQLLKAENLFISVDAYLQKWDSSTALLADQLIVFNDTPPKWTTKCSSSLGPGPFCRQNQVSQTLLDNINTLISDKHLSKSKFVAIQYKVPKYSLVKTLNDIYSTIASSLFVTDALKTGTSEPSYWDSLLVEASNLLNKRNGHLRSGTLCGCHDTDECLSDPCPVNSVCSNKVGGYECSCSEGFVGQPSDSGVLECNDVDECKNQICDANAQCTNTNGSYSCDCLEGFSGDGISCEDTDECLTKSVQCANYADCVNEMGTFTCVCQLGYQGDGFLTGTQCTDVDECAENADNCHPNAICTNTSGSFECSCKSGFSGTGEVCSDIDECLSSTDSCGQNSLCSNTAGSFDCVCNSGFTGSEGQCIDIDECTQNIHNCVENSECQNTPGSFTCSCKTGFAQNGGLCIDIDECGDDSNECHSMATCENTLGSYACSCIDNWSGDGKICSQDICSLCSADATCDRTQCLCPEGFDGNGIRCDQNLLAIPIQKTPLITVKSAICRDTYWQKIANDSTNLVILKLQEASWNPCINLLIDSGLEVYGTIDLKGGKVHPQVAFATKIIDDQAQSMRLSGIMLTNPGDDGFEQTFVSEVIDHIRSKGLKVGVDAYQQKLSMDTIHKSDVVILFKDRYNKYHRECISGREKTPFCRQSKISDTFIDSLRQSLADGLDQSKLLTMIFATDSSQMKKTVSRYFNGDFAGRLFLTDQTDSSLTHEPIYFDDFVAEVKSSSNTRQTCGCNDINECELENICPLNAECTNTVSSFDCACSSGYQTVQKGSITACIDVDECLVNQPCDDNAVCVNKDGSFECICNSGFTGDGITCNDIDECSDVNVSCQLNSDCTNTAGSFACVCRTGFYFVSDQGTPTCVDADECLSGTDNCHHSALCSNNEGSYTCACKTGYSGDGFTCIDDNECSLLTHDCDSNSHCINSAGSYSCNCKVGFEKSGTSCEDVDECVEDSHSCDEHAQCTNNLPGYSCLCNTGYIGDGFTCVDIDECDEQSSNCHPMADCVNTSGSFECQCVNGWNGDGVTCSQDICSLCDSSASCDSTCSCPEGYQGSGIACAQNKIMVPIQKTPYISLRSDLCKDSYWIELAQTKSVSVVLNLQERTWLPCIKLLQESGLEVYATINVRKSSSSQFATDLIDEIVQDFGQSITGIMIRNPVDKEGFTHPEYKTVFNYAHSLGLSIGIQAYNRKFDSATLQLVDHAVIFRGLKDAYTDSCIHEVGPFCQQDQLSASAVADIRNAIDSGLIETTKMSSMVYGVSNADLDEVTAIHYGGAAPGGLFISDQSSVKLTNRPSYFDLLVSLVNSNSNSRSTADCGCSDIDECSLFSTPCGANTVCSNSVGSFSCECHHGFDPIDDISCSDTDECFLQLDNCDENADCSNTAGSFDCSCKTGWSGNGVTCSDINECALSLCSSNADCSNTAGSFECNCREGFSGNGLECVDIDECIESDSCSENMNCFNTSPGYSCQCKDGYQLDFTTGTCYDIDECSGDNDCHIMAQCSNTDGSYTCTCLESFHGDGFTCVSDICDACVESAVCDGSACICPAGTEGTGIECPSSKLIVPLRNPPLVNRLGRCNDPYWLKLSQIQSLSVIVERQNPTWIPCLEELAKSQTNVFLAVNTDQSSSDWDTQLKLQIDEALTVYKNVFSGVHIITTANSVGFTDAKYREIFDYIKIKRLRISVDGHDTSMNLEVINTADQVIIFDGLASKFISNCGIYGAGPFCQLSQNHDVNFISTLLEAVDNRLISTEKLGSLVYQVSSDKLQETIDTHYEGSLPGPIFVSDSVLTTMTRKPAYFDQLVALVMTKTKSASTCGCSDLNECDLGTHQCVANSDCINVPITRDSRGYQCHCSAGYTYNLSTGSFVCQDVDECQNESHQCNQQTSDCVNTDGSYSCQCHTGYETDPTSTLECTDTNECSQNTDSCLSDEMCVNTVGSHLCTPVTSDENDECLLGLHGCPNNSHCLDVSMRRDPRGYQCHCDPGYYCSTCYNNAGPALFSCSDANECTSGTHTCHSTTTCLNTEGSFECVCGDDEELENGICVPIEKCLTGLHQCPENSKCEMGSSSDYTCHCESGYRSSVSTLSGSSQLSCVDIDECSEGTHDCPVGESCVNIEASFTCHTIDCSSFGCSHYCQEAQDNTIECICPAGYDLDLDGKTCLDIDECLQNSHSCSETSICVNTLTYPRKGRTFLNILTTNGFICRCPDGFNWDTTGSDCVDENECDGGTHDCSVDEVCVNSEGSFSCVIADCSVLGCSHTCTQGQLPCTCPQDLSLAEDALTCVDQDECALNLDHCPQDSHCVNTRKQTDVRGYYCSCNLGFTPVQSADGSYICVDTDECSTGANECVENSVCINTVSKSTNRGYECHCTTGFYGTVSSSGGFACADLDECATGQHSCGETEVCINSVGSFSCSDRDECSSPSLNTCPANSSCVNVRATKKWPRGYQCFCDNGYHGVQNSLGELECVDVNECESGLHSCVENSDCTNVDRHKDSRGYQCHCRDGYQGTFSSGTLRCVDIDECANNSHNCEYQCTNTDGSFDCQAPDCTTLGCSHTCENGQCKCPAGTELDGVNCVDVDECARGDHICPENTDCINTSNWVFGGYQCHCQVGFTSDISTGVFKCVDIDECALNVDSCLTDELCLNSSGSYTCAPNLIEDNDECTLGTHQCPANSYCSDTLKRLNPRGYNCYCNEGYHCEGCTTGSPFICSEIDECALGTHICTADQECINTEGSFSCVDKQCLSLACSHSCQNGACSCPRGMALDSDQSTCSNINECALGLAECPDNSNCVDTTLNKLTPKGYRCLCDAGFAMNNNTCIDVNECSNETDNCSAHHVCQNTVGSFNCVNICQDIGCSHSCEGSQCTCPDGMSLDPNGKACTDVDECALGTHQCVPNSDCVNTSVGRISPRGYNCFCSSGFNYNYENGVFSCVDVDECLSSPCAEHEICSNTIGSFSCIDESQCLLCSHDCIDGLCTCPNGMVLDASGTQCELTDENVAIKCDSNSMEVLVERAYFETSDGFQLNDPKCDIQSGHITDAGDGTYSIKLGLDDCGTEIEIVGDDIVFSNTLFNNYETAGTKGLIFKEPIVTVKFSCVYSTKLDVDGAHTVQAAFIRGSAAGRGDFSFNLETFSDSQFSIPSSTGFRTGDIMYFDVVNENPMKDIKFTGWHF